MPPKRNVSPAAEVSNAMQKCSRLGSSAVKGSAKFRPSMQSSATVDECSEGLNNRTTRIMSYKVVKSEDGTKLKEESRMQRQYIPPKKNKNKDSDNVGKEADNIPETLVDDDNIHEEVHYDDNKEIEGDDERDKTTAGKLRPWVPLQGVFLDEFLRLDGKVGKDPCYQCKVETGVYQCGSCMDGRLCLCKECMVKKHAHLPLHRIQKYNGEYFDKDTLKNLGLVIQLGHEGAGCLIPTNTTTLVVVDGYAIHQVEVTYCDCKKEVIPNYTQLLRAKWFPASFIRPQTVFTFQGLEIFHELNFKGKTSLYDWYYTLCRLTDKCKLEDEMNRYNEFRHVMRMWRILMMSKHAGRGQFTEGISGTTPGELTVECPACPHPNKNLPENWSDVDASLKFLYILYLAVDANFKLSCKERGIKDIDLMPGWGAYVEEGNYQAHLKSYKETPEINTCDSGHDAILQAGIHTAPGHSVTGTALVICARHAFIQRNGAGDLQKGERYCNIDYIILSALMGTMLSWIVITYDIGCQWSKNLRKRIEEYPEHMRISPDVKIDVGVPAWHLNAHGHSCQSNFALAYLPGAGRTCGEEVETTWSNSNNLRPSTREMGLSARQELLNDHWNDWNEQKLIGLRFQLNDDFIEAIKMMIKHREIFEKFCKTFKPEVLRELESLVINWEKTHTGVNPYHEPEQSNALQVLRLEYIRDETSSFKQGEIPKHKMTLSKFLFAALEIEEQQHILQLEINKLGKNLSPKQLADLHEKRLSLATRIRQWQEVQLAYMPDVSTLLAPALKPQHALDTSVEDDAIIEAELLPIQLPSKLSVDCCNYLHTQIVANAELKLRKAQAQDALAEIRHLRCMISTVWQFKQDNASGTGNKPNTRLRSLYERFQNKVKLCADRYRMAYLAVTVLEPNGEWLKNFRELKNEDIKGPQKDDSESRGKYEISWIWLVPQANVETANSVEAINISLKVEWAKCRARNNRWEEEVLILKEEMRRVVTYLEWKADWWKNISDGRKYESNIGDDIKKGIRAYALKQSSICTMLSQACINKWVPTFIKNKDIPDWAQTYVNTLTIISTDKIPNPNDEDWQDIDENTIQNDENENEGGYPIDRFELGE